MGANPSWLNNASCRLYNPSGTSPCFQEINRMSSRFATSILVFLLCVSSTIVTAVEAPQRQKQNADQLIRTAQKAVAKLVKSARGEPKLDPGSADAKPFWEAMKQANESLSKAETGLALKDNTFSRAKRL